jgi:hypothetical protein
VSLEEAAEHLRALAGQIVLAAVEHVPLRGALLTHRLCGSR